MGATRTEVEAYLDAGVEFRKACRLWPSRVVELTHYPMEPDSQSMQDPAFWVSVCFGEALKAEMEKPAGWLESIETTAHRHHETGRPVLLYKYSKPFPYKRREA